MAELLQPGPLDELPIRARADHPKLRLRGEPHGVLVQKLTVEHARLRYPSVLLQRRTQGDGRLQIAHL